MLFECKALRPSLELLHYGSQEAIETLRERVVSALEQVIIQTHDMQRGAWADEGLVPSPTICVLISYGRFYTVNLVSFRDRVRAALSAKGHIVPPFVVLSLKEFDTVIRHTELGEPLDRILFQVTEAEFGRCATPSPRGSMASSLPVPSHTVGMKNLNRGS